MTQRPAPPPLSVIIPAYNRPDDLATLLASLEPEFHRVETVVVDDASPDAAAYEDLQRRFPCVRFLRQDRNRGPAAARNRGAQAATSDLLLFLDSDTAVCPGIIDAVLRIFRDHPTFVACGGTSDKQPLNGGFFPKYKALVCWSWVADRAGRITYVGHVGGRAFAVRRSTMLELGGFNENLATPDIEDYEFGYRLRKAHGPIPFSTDIRVHHRFGTALNQGRLYFRRVAMWLDLRSQSPGPDDVGTTSREAFVAMAATGMTLTLLVALLHPAMVWAAGALALTTAWLGRGFLRLCLREYGVRFMAAAFACHTFLAWFICAGATLALSRTAWQRLRSMVTDWRNRIPLETEHATGG